MDDDCERGQFKAHHVMVTLIDYGAINIKTKSKKIKTNGSQCFNDNVIYLSVEELKSKAEGFKCKDSHSESEHYSRTIEIHYEEEGAKPILAQVNFPYDSEV